MPATPEVSVAERLVDVREELLVPQERLVVHLVLLLLRLTL